MTEPVVTVAKQRLRSWKSYPAYREPEIEWLQLLPTHWSIKRLKSFTDIALSNVDKKTVEGERSVLLCNYVDVYYNERITSGIDFMSATATAEQVRRFELRRGDVLVTKDSETSDDIAVAALVADNLPGVLCGYHLARIRPHVSEVDGAYLAHAFSAVGLREQFHIAANGVTRFGLSADAIGSALFPVPPVPEQRAIAAFLDRETAKIDALIAKKERLLDLLREKHAALITRAVTNGLGPSVPVKDSGVEWLGQIPAHWSVKKLKALCFLQTGITLGKRYDAESLVVRPYLRVANVQDGFLDLADIAEIELPNDETRRYELERGDVLLTEGGDFDKLGRGYVWEGQIPGCLHQNHIFAVRPRQADLASHFLAAVMSSDYGRAYFTATSKQSTNLASTNSTNLKNFPLAVPPRSEQESIMRFIAHEVAKLDRIARATRGAVDRLQELRTAVISAAVTGKIDVREQTA